MAPSQIDPIAAFEWSSQPPSSWCCDNRLKSAQYLSIKYTERLAEAGIEPSVGSIGDSYDCKYGGAARGA
jgi:transposase InsO family protein